MWEKPMSTIGSKQLCVKVLVRASAGTLILSGREAWALRELARAGNDGTTPITTPGPRWSSYVHKLRRKYGFDIETIREPHGGKFPGHHARYVLRTVVDIIDPDDEFDQVARAVLRRVA
jgi:hypothetical protein